MLVRTLTIALVTIAALCTRVSNAHAFENVWHAGADAGWVVPTTSYHPGFGYGLHGAYGLSDVFDLRLTLSTSRHGPHPTQAAAGSANLTQATLGIAYKLDVLSWIPYLGVRAGGMFWSAPPASGYAPNSATLGVMLGVDYFFARRFAAGLEIARDMTLRREGATSALLRIEYHTGP